MFERYTEKTRRVIFFARYEASCSGSPYIQTEHILLALVREDKTLADQFGLPYANLMLLGEELQEHITIRTQERSSVDLPFSQKSRRVLADGAEEAERLKSRYITPSHLLLGLLRDEESLASKLLRKHGFTPSSFRDLPQPLVPQQSSEQREAIAGLDRWLAASKALTGISIVTGQQVANRKPYCAIYEGTPTLRAFMVDANEAPPKSLQPQPQALLLCIDVVHDQKFSEL